MEVLQEPTYLKSEVTLEELEVLKEPEEKPGVPKGGRTKKKKREKRHAALQMAEVQNEVLLL